METMQIAIPETIHDYVRERVHEGGFGSASDYVCELIRLDRKRRAKQKLEDLLVEGLNSGDPMEGTAEFWEECWRDAQMRLRNESNA